MCVCVCVCVYVYMCVLIDTLDHKMIYIKNYCTDSMILVVMMCVNIFIYAPVTRPYICQRAPTYGDTSDK